MSLNHGRYRYIPEEDTNIARHEGQDLIEYEFNKLNVSENSKCSYCDKLFTEKLWCNECDPHCIIEGWTSGNSDIDKFIKDTMYDARHYNISKLLEWVPFDKFTDIKEIGEGGFAKVYSATWIDGALTFNKQDDGSWKKGYSGPMKVALKRLNGSWDISANYLNELKAHWDFNKQDEYRITLTFYGITKDPETKEFIMIVKYLPNGNLRSYISNNFNNILWKEKIKKLYHITDDLINLQNLGYCHKDFHSGNILQDEIYSYVSDFGLTGPADKQKTNDNIYGVLPYIAPEVLNGELYTLASDIYSFGIIMAELSTGNPPFYDRKHDVSLALDICNGLRPEFEKGTPEFYKELAYRCMNANPNQRPTSKELQDILYFWFHSIEKYGYKDTKKYGYYGKEIKKAFEEADKDIPNIIILRKTNPDAVYISRAFAFKNLTKPINSSLITSYLEKDENNKDSQLYELKISSSLQLKDVNN